jgi:ribonuclease HII
MTRTNPTKRRAESRRLARLLVRERELWESGVLRVAGVDEVGVGPLAGPVVAAAVVFPVGTGVRGVNDSKQLEPIRRLTLAHEIRAAALGWAVARVEPSEIDEINIYHAALEAMRRAVSALAPAPERVLVDARTIPGIETPQEKWIRGDARCHAIAAASILAKTARDAWMEEYDHAYPGYGFAEHKGYSTAQHRAAVRRLGPSPIHRRSFTLPQPTLFDLW